jgi:hypothetical protein
VWAFFLIIHYSFFIIHYSLSLFVFCPVPLSQVLRNHMQVVGLCPTPHKLFEKSLIKNFTKVGFVLLLALTLALPKPACAGRAKMTARPAGAGRYFPG